MPGDSSATATPAPGPQFLALRVRFLAGTYGGVEWPPSPFRLLQAMVAGHRPVQAPGLAWLAEQPAPFILAGEPGEPLQFQRAVPNNADPRKPTSATSLRSIVQRRVADTPLLYLWPLRCAADHAAAAEVVASAALVHTLGTGEDMCAVSGHVGAQPPESAPGLTLWCPHLGGAVAVQSEGDVCLQVPVAGSLAALEARFQAFRQRLDPGELGFARPVPAPALHAVVRYRDSAQAARHSLLALRLQTVADRTQPCRFAPGHAVVVGGLLRHAAMQQAARWAPGDAALADFAAGYGPETDRDRRLSWVPVPSVGHRHADGLIRRGLWLARAADAPWLARLAQSLPEAGLPLVDEHSGEQLGWAQSCNPLDEPVLAGLLRPARCWVSVTPVVLPGDHASDLRRMTQLLRKAVRESGLDPGLLAHAEFSAQPLLRQAPALRDVRLKQWQAQRLVLTHVRVHLREAVRGPLVLGRGRHFGLGLMCADRE